MSSLGVAYGEPRLVKHQEGEYSDGDENHINGLEGFRLRFIGPLISCRRLTITI